jgi:TatA/E family protein of Tat protein translocase
MVGPMSYGSDNPVNQEGLRQMTANLAFGFGPWEMWVILLIALLLFGHRIPGMARSLGSGIVEFKRGLKGDSGGSGAVTSGTTPSQPAPPAEPAPPPEQPAQQDSSTSSSPDQGAAKN